MYVEFDVRKNTGVEDCTHFMVDVKLRPTASVFLLNQATKISLKSGLSSDIHIYIEEGHHKEFKHRALGIFRMEKGSVSPPGYLLVVSLHVAGYQA